MASNVCELKSNISVHYEVLNSKIWWMDLIVIYQEKYFKFTNRKKGPSNRKRSVIHLIKKIQINPMKNY